MAKNGSARALGGKLVALQTGDPRALLRLPKEAPPVESEKS